MFHTRVIVIKSGKKSPFRRFVCFRNFCVPDQSQQIIEVLVKKVVGSI